MFRGVIAVECPVGSMYLSVAFSESDIQHFDGRLQGVAGLFLMAVCVRLAIV